MKFQVFIPIHLNTRQRSIDVQVDENTREAKMRKTMCKLWTNFGKFGDPTPNHENPLKFKWKESSYEKDLQYLVIDDEDKIKMEQNLSGNRVNYWREVYRKWNRSFIPAKL